MVRRYLAMCAGLHLLESHPPTVWAYRPERSGLPLLTLARRRYPIVIMRRGYVSTRPAVTILQRS
jgi:hypothetical protein